MKAGAATRGHTHVYAFHTATARYAISRKNQRYWFARLRYFEDAVLPVLENLAASMYRTLWRLSASKSARSPSVSAEKSSMLQCRTQPFAGLLLQVAKHVIDASNVDSWVFRCDLMRLAPASLVTRDPCALCRRQ
jgi:hypothetical protein